MAQQDELALEPTDEAAAKLILCTSPIDDNRRLIMLFTKEQRRQCKKLATSG
jgi:hypothetical protein